MYTPYKGIISHSKTTPQTALPQHQRIFTEVDQKKKKKKKKKRKANKISPDWWNESFVFRSFGHSAEALFPVMINFRIICAEMRLTIVKSD